MFFVIYNPDFIHFWRIRTLPHNRYWIIIFFYWFGGLMPLFSIYLSFYRLRHTVYNIKITIVESHPYIFPAAAQKRNLHWGVSPSGESNRPRRTVRSQRLNNLFFFVTDMTWTRSRCVTTRTGRLSTTSSRQCAPLWAAPSPWPASSTHASSQPQRSSRSSSWASSTEK